MGIKTFDDAPGQRSPNEKSPSRMDGPVKTHDVDRPPKKTTKPASPMVDGGSPRFIEPGTTRKIR